jgi:E3 ubiquitin-protein ligase NEDD4
MHISPDILSLSSHSTCFNRIDLPNYTSKKLLFERLKAAVTLSAVGFGIE